jgi:hypothetical protein
MDQLMAPITLNQDDYVEAYGLACDAIERGVWAEHDGGIDPDDGLLHTSDYARRVAMAVFDAVGVVADPPFPPPTAEEADNFRRYFQRSR